MTEPKKDSEYPLRVRVAYYGVVLGVAALVFIIGFVGYSFLTGLEVISETTSDVITFSEPIVQLSDASAISGNFFLGIGSVKENTYYYYYSGSNGRYQLKRLNTEGVTIVYDNTTPRVERHQMTTRTVRRNGNINQYTELFWRSEIHIPEGSIKTMYNLDGVS